MEVNSTSVVFVFCFFSLFEGETMTEPADYHDMIMGYPDPGEKVCIRLVNTEKYREILTHLAHLEWNDLSVIFYFIPRFRGDGAYKLELVNTGFLEHLQITTQELFDSSVQHSSELLPVSFNPIEEVLDLPEEKTDRSGLYVLTNSFNFFGASCVLYPDTLKKIGGRIGDFYILPSSVHEVLLLPVRKCRFPVGELRRIVHDINKKSVSEEDWLTDSVYYYNYAKDTCICI